jgi:hypothetical protein
MTRAPRIAIVGGGAGAADGSAGHRVSQRRHAGGLYPFPSRIFQATVSEDRP